MLKQKMVETPNHRLVPYTVCVNHCAVRVKLFCLLRFFFFKQKTAYEIRLSLVGSEMCIRDRYIIVVILL